MPQSLANFDAALKDDYGPGLKNAINNSNPVLTEATKNDEDIVGRRAVWSVHTGRSASTSARAELGSLHTADRQRFSQVTDELAYLYHTVKVSGQAKHLTSNDRGAFTRALESELDGAEKDLKNDVSRQVFGQKLTDGTSLQSGVIATLSADPGTGTTFTFGAEATSIARHFFAGEIIQAIDPATGAVRSGGPYTVVSVSKANKTVTTSAAIDASVASGDYLVRAGAVATSAALTNFGNEINGLRFLLGTGVYAGIDPATVPAWQALQVGSSTAPISEVLLDETVEAVETDGSGDTPTLTIYEHTQQRKLASQLQTQKRYDGATTTLTAGWQGLKLARTTAVADRYAPSTRAFVLTPKYLVRFVGLDWTWDDDDGKVLYKALDDSDAVQARFKTYMNLEVTLRNAHSLLTLAEPVF
jgi:hypothetical protein